MIREILLLLTQEEETRTQRIDPAAILQEALYATWLARLSQNAERRLTSFLCYATRREIQTDPESHWSREPKEHPEMPVSCGLQLKETRMHDTLKALVSDVTNEPQIELIWGSKKRGLLCVDQRLAIIRSSGS